MDKVLIDTDVLMDFFFDRKPFSKYATYLINKCANKEIHGFTTPLIISNVYYLLRKTAKHDKIVEKIKQLITIVDILNIDQSVVLEALNSEFKDFEDALQNYSATKKGEIKYIITRNLKDFKKSELSVMTPEIYLKSKAVN